MNFFTAPAVCAQGQGLKHVCFNERCRNNAFLRRYMTVTELKERNV